VKKKGERENSTTFKGEAKGGRLKRTTQRGERTVKSPAWASTEKGDRGETGDGRPRKHAKGGRLGGTLYKKSETPLPELNLRRKGGVNKPQNSGNGQGKQRGWAKVIS